MRMIKKINGIPLCTDPYEDGIFISVFDLKGLSQEQIQQIVTLAAPLQREAEIMNMFIMNRSRWNSFLDQFLRKGDAAIVLSGELFTDDEKNELLSHLNGNDVAHLVQPRVHKEKSKQKGAVYLLKAGPFYKIGVSKDVTKRAKQLSTLPPFDLEIIHAVWVDDSYGLEAKLHKRFADKRKNGEWFTLNDEDVKYIKAIGGTPQ